MTLTSLRPTLTVCCALVDAVSTTALLRDRIETVGQDNSQDEQSRIRTLDALRQEIVGLLGACDQYLGSLDKYRQAQSLAQEADVQRAREHADLRERLLAEGIASSDECYALGYLSNEDLDELAEEGLLYEAVSRVKVKWLDELQEAFDPGRHPRGRGGKWIRVFGHSEHHNELVSGMEARKVFRDSQRRADSNVEVHTTKGKVIVGGVRNVGASTVTIEDHDGSGHRIKLEDIGTISVLGMTVGDSRDSHGPRPVATPTPTTHFDGPTPPSALTPDGHPALRPASYSPEIEKIQTADDAEKYLTSKFGIEALLHSDGKNGEAPPQFFRDIAQAVTDANDRYPALFNGKARKFGGIGLWSPLRDASVRSGYTEGTQDGVWATTGSDPRITDMSPRGEYDHPEAKVWIAINDVKGPWHGDNPVAGRGVALADKHTYGSLMHELGHAVAMTSGFDGPTEQSYDDPVMHLLDGADFGPLVAYELSPYGSSSPNEVWAEVFSTINVPGAMDKVPYDLRRRIQALQAQATYDGQKLL